MPILRRVAALAAATLVAAAATLALPSAPAQAAYCSGGAGVSVVVDFGALGGGSATGCGGGASVASTAFKNAGFALTPHPRQQGFVCKVNSKPADGNCMGTNAYWGFFVSDDGKGWVYASQGVFQQAVDSGDSVALVWQSSSGQRRPGTSPAPSTGGSAPVAPSGKTTNRPKPKPTTRPATPTPTVAATRRVASPQATLSTAPTPSESAKPKPKPKPTPTATPTPAATATDDSTGATLSVESSPTGSGSTQASTEPVASDEGGGLPGWLAPALVGVLALAAGGVAWARRTR
ncbi:hypothetical protein [Nocardioides sp. CER19]|uniref:hypothetical protein n=1 Tax=Nocardioides sp. CER19 TaxID=3038538 RepID=UPI002447BD18|nr:hypothetical protein [Nocardioides sp. CER19]MDH2414101.1 hypothetical protein [Nocardioides sp. CER19]